MRSRTATGIVAGVCATVFLCTAALSLAAIDRNGRRFEGNNLAAAPLPLSKSSAAGSALPAVVAAVLAARHGAPLPSDLVPPIGQVRTTPPQYMPPQGCIGRDTSPVIRTRTCTLGDKSSHRVIVLLGDSHANMWLPAVLEMAWRDHWRVVPLVRLGCTPGNWGSGSRASCREWYSWAVSRIRQLRPNVILMGGSIGELPSPSTRAATEGMIDAARALKAIRPVVVMGDPESLAHNPINCLLAPDASMANCTTTWPAASLRAYDQVAAATKRMHVGFLRTRGFVCFQRECPAVIGHSIVWRDSSHMTAVYSAQLVDAFRAGFLRALG